MKLDQPIAALAIQMIMLGIPVVVLIDISAAQAHFFQQTGFVQLGERPIDRRPRNLSTGQEILKMFEQFFDVEMVVVAEYLFYDEPPLLRQPFTTTSQKLAKPFQRRKRNTN